MPLVTIRQKVQEMKGETKRRLGVSAWNKVFSITASGIVLVTCSPYEEQCGQVRRLAASNNVFAMYSFVPLIQNRVKKIMKNSFVFRLKRVFLALKEAKFPMIFRC